QLFPDPHRARGRGWNPSHDLSHSASSAHSRESGNTAQKENVVPRLGAPLAKTGSPRLISGLPQIGIDYAQVGQARLSMGPSGSKRGSPKCLIFAASGARLRSQQFVSRSVDVAEGEHKVEDLTAEDVAKGIEAGRYLLIDVREPNEVSVVAYPDAVVL